MTAALLQQWQTFVQSGLPTRHQERWKYADLSFLAQQSFALARRLDPAAVQAQVAAHRLPPSDAILLVFVNGYFMPTLSEIDRLPAHAVQPNRGLIGIDAMQYPFAAMCAAMPTDELTLSIADATEVKLPIHLLFIADDQVEFVAQPQHTILVGRCSKVTILEEHIGLSVQPYLMNINTKIILEAGATFLHNKIQAESIEAVHVANTFVIQKKDSSAVFTNFSSGSKFARDDLVVGLQEAGAICRAGGFYRLRHAQQYIDHHVDITHVASHCDSEMLYKGVLEAKSRAVFNGRLCVEPNAQKTQAYQANHNLLLSPEAEIYSKPELEIDADDVRCKHGATVGQINSDAIFYMRSRGISEAEAMNILLHGFADEIFQRVIHVGYRQRAQEVLL